MAPSDPLLSTKIAIPPVRRHVVRRDRLLARLNAGLRRRLTLVSAPAGFGKTTLVSTWVSELRRERDDLAVAWLSLDEGESDLMRFLAYVLATVARAVPELAPLLPSVGVAGLPVQPQTALGGVINTVDAWSGQLILVLDDYHLISGPEVHALLTSLLDHLPPNLHLVIVTRADPPLPLSRFRGRSQLVEVRAGDLRFTDAEAAAFLGNVMGLSLTAESVGRLAHRTEGWAVGLQMAAISMRGREDVASFIEAFAGSHRYVMDYLLAEVWEQQPSEVQAFLLRTSILDELTAPLCDAVLADAVDGEEGRTVAARGAPGRAQEMLLALERANLFIVPLDEERVWFRYHRLFADLLVQRRQRLPPAEVAALHRRASVWYESHGMAADAIDHLLAIPDYASAAKLISEAAESTLARSELTTFSGWIDALPVGVRDRHPELGIYIAWTQFWQGRAPHQIEVDLSRLSSPSASDAGRVGVLRSLFALYRGEVAAAIAYARDALVSLHPDDMLFRGISTVLQTLQRVDEGDPRRFQEELLRLAERSVSRGNVLAATLAMNTLAELLMREGHLQQSGDIYARSLELACDHRGRRLPIAGQALIGQAVLAWMRGNDERAEALLDEGIPLARQAGEMVALDGLLLLARIRRAAGHVEAAWALLEESLHLALQSDATRLDDRMVAIDRARHWIETGDLLRARQWVDERGLKPPTFGARPTESVADGSERVRKYEVLMAAAVLAAQGEHETALAALDWTEGRFEVRRRPLMLVDALVLEGWVHAQRGAGVQASAALERALSLAASQDYVRPFLDAGPGLAELLTTAAVRGVKPQFVGRLLSLFGRTAPTQPDGAPTTPVLLDALTERELDVLRLLPTHLSSTEIAERLTVSPNTVRTHIKNIYSKLDVHSRDAAVCRAQALGLL